MRKLFLAACLLLLWCAPLRAETLANIHDLAKSPRIRAYVNDRAVFNELFRRGKEQDQRLGLAQGCAGNATVTVKNLILLEPIELPEGATHPSKGAWQYRYLLTRCGESTVYNVVAVAGKNGAPPVYKTYFPGSTMASVQLVRDTMVPAMAAAAGRARPDKDCKKINVLDMRVTENQETAGRTPWTEVWTFNFCGKPGDAEITFTPDADNKGTTFVIKNLAPRTTQP